MSSSDLQLLERWNGRRDAEAFHALVQRHAAMVHNTACRVLRRPEDAEEITQDCFVRLASGTHSVRESVPGWLHTLALRMALDRLRSDSRRRRREQRYQSDLPRSARPELDDLLREVDAVIAELPDTLRQPVVLYFLSSQTQDAIALQLGISRSAVSRRLARGTESIRVELRRRGIAVPITGLAAVFAESAVAVPPNVAANLGRIVLANAASRGFAGATEKAVRTATAASWSSIGFTKAAVMLGVAFLAILGVQRVRTDADERPHAVMDNRAALAMPREPVDDVDNSMVTAAAPALATGLALPADDPPVDTSCAAVSGRVVAGDGVPISGAEVMLIAFGYDVEEPANRDSYRQREIERSEDHRFTTTTDRNGNYTFDGITLFGSALVRAHKPAFRYGAAYVASEPFVMLEPGASLTGIDISLSPGRTLRGRVVSAAGVGVSGARVESLAVTWESERINSLYEYGKAETDGVGRFALDILDKSEFCAVVVDAAGHGTVTFPNVAVTDSEVTLQLVPLANLSGTITGIGAADSGNLDVVLEGQVKVPRENYISGYFGGRYTADIDSDGRYRIGGIDPGQTYDVAVVDATGKGRTIREELPAFTPGKAGVWDCTLTPPAYLRGTVRALGSGMAVEGIMLWCQRTSAEEDLDMYQSREMLSGGDGAFSFEILNTPGEFMVHPNQPDGRELYGATAWLKGGDDVEMTIEIPPPCTQSIQVVTPDGIPIADTFVQVIMGEGWHGESGRADSEGRFTYGAFAPDMPGSFELKQGGYLDTETPEIVGNPGDVFPEQTIVMWPAASITATLCNEEGIAMAETKVCVSSVYGPGLECSFTCTTNQVGMLECGTSIPAEVTSLEIAVDSTDANASYLPWTAGPMSFEAGACNDLGTIILQAAGE